MKLFLGVDALSAPLTGIGRYTYALATGLKRHREIETLRYPDARGVFDDLAPGLELQRAGTAGKGGRR